MLPLFQLVMLVVLTLYLYNNNRLIRVLKKGLAQREKLIEIQDRYIESLKSHCATQYRLLRSTIPEDIRAEVDGNTALEQLQREVEEQEQERDD